MENMEHITHTCATTYAHLPYEDRERHCRTWNWSESTRQKRVARNTDRRPMTVPEMLLGLDCDELGEEFLVDLLEPYGFGVYRIEGEVCPVKTHCEGLDFNAQQAMHFSNGVYEQSEKRSAIKKLTRLIASKMGMLNWLKRTQNQKTRIYAAE